MSKSVCSRKSCFKLFIVCSYFSLFIACSDSSQPFEPEVEDPLDFFPLKEGYAVEYDYKFSSSEYIPQGHSKDLNRLGRFQLEVVLVLEKETAINFKIKSTFLISNENYSFKNLLLGATPIFRDTSYVRENFFTETQFDLLLEKDTLWYVTDAPSFERLEEGKRSICLAGPTDSGVKMDLRLFDFPVAYGLFSTLGVWEIGEKTTADAYIYNTSEAKIVLVRNKGFERILIKAWTPTTNQQVNQTADYVIVE